MEHIFLLFPRTQGIEQDFRTTRLHQVHILFVYCTNQLCIIFKPESNKDLINWEPNQQTQKLQHSLNEISQNSIISSQRGKKCRGKVENTRKL